MYDDLVKCLRRCGYCDDLLDCDCCEYNNTTEYIDRECYERLMLQAADAIENLSKAYQMMAEAYEAEVTNWMPLPEPPEAVKTAFEETEFGQLTFF